MEYRGKALSLNRKFKKVHVVCAVCDPYPALSAQAEHFLQYQTTDVICAPLVTDLFALDAMAEMLSSPIYFLDYLDKRARYAGRLSSFFELTILGYHLAHNLWLDDEHDHLTLADDSQRNP
jgi:hypothetical protein